MNLKTSSALAAAITLVSLGAATLPAQAAPPAIVVQIAPPPPRMEPVPSPRRGMVWVPGYWDWRGHRHVWVAGTWMRERPGYRYVQPAWVQRGGRWEMQRGGWARGDRDRDGVPNQFDRHPNDPYRR